MWPGLLAAGAVLALLLAAPLMPPGWRVVPDALRLPLSDWIAARMTGCSHRQTLCRVELPVALPRLATGLNQVVMMTLNMVSSPR